ncbi:hypothetical protein CROQUDRAFT_133791 [Cronartium quercuum f. sp. fusiforme G11]|uniref:NodB homology domain-containing protein n=1 Tax=Cronartium quercuum f. sp. fusiforme G11 TaxID=708437 RepID=A0A9P6NEJ1_9BASI|nr:hypothetical protein CROQUDRAFT_133791 [Cronartium quercuum f. sp. fusiforme G11]
MLIGFIIMSLSFLSFSLASFVIGKNMITPTYVSLPGSLGRVIQTCKKNGTFALTFEDEPYKYENVISDYLLSECGIQGMFFVNGFDSDCIYNKTSADRLIQTFGQGHLIASHTWSHPNIVNLLNLSLFGNLI